MEYWSLRPQRMERQTKTNWPGKAWRPPFLFNHNQCPKFVQKYCQFSQSAGWWTSPSYTYTELFSGARRPRSAHAHTLGTRTGSAEYIKGVPPPILHVSRKNVRLFWLGTKWMLLLAGCFGSPVLAVALSLVYKNSKASADIRTLKNGQRTSCLTRTLIY